MREPTVFVVDDDPAVRNSLRWLLESVQYHVQTFATAEEFLSYYAIDMTGCLILDIRMPGMTGLQLQKQLIKQAHALPIIFITGHGDIPQAVRAMQQGALHFLEKPLNDQALLEAISTAIEQDKQQQARRMALVKVKERLSNLTQREREVLDLVLERRPNKDIAEKLGITIKTVEFHRARMMEKMEAESVFDLIEIARDSPILTGDA